MDKKLNEVTKVTDMAYVPVIMADGSIGQIAKSDLASVVAGVLGNPAGTKGYIENVYPNISSYDEVVSSGIYTISDSVSVSPKNGVLVVNASSAVVFQTFYGQNGDNQSRLRWYGNWSPWQRIDNFGYNSLAELAGGVAEMFNKSYAQDMNDAVGHNESGMYSNSTLNLPSGLTGVGVYTVFRAKYEVNNSLFLVQMLFPEDSASNDVYIRKCWNDTWTSWKRITTP